MNLLSRFDLHECRKPRGREPQGVEVATHEKTSALDRDVRAYSGNWQLVGVFMRCVFCAESQRASDSAKPFEHMQDCPKNTNPNQFPWLQHTRILKNLPLKEEHQSRLSAERTAECDR